MTRRVETDRSVASQLALGLLEDEMRRKGKVISIPSLGIILVPKYLKHPETAKPPTIEAVKEALQVCLTAQERRLEEAADEAEKAKIEEVVASLREDLADPSQYL